MLPTAVQVLRMWLLRLFKEHNVTTVTSTGHSLGGALATISAFGVADLLEQQWEGWDKAGWKTQVSSENDILRPTSVCLSPNILSQLLYIQWCIHVGDGLHVMLGNNRTAAEWGPTAHSTHKRKFTPAT
jgi:hypothetical protein